MTKAKKIEYINSVMNRFTNARNHGHNGESWWYPKPNIIAYNVKIYAWMDSDKLREMMSERQNEFYTDSDILDFHYEMMEQEQRQAIETVKEMGACDACFAGRSGGWLEVEYDNPLDYVDENTSAEDLRAYYEQAKELEKKEAEISAWIENGAKTLKKYIGSRQYPVDTLDIMLDDEAIGNIYKSNAQKILEKLK